MAILAPEVDVRVLPTHKDLPDKDGSFVKNFQEHPQSILLTDTILPVLNRLHPDGQYAIGQDSGIFWRVTDPPLLGCKAPDWFYVPGVSPLVDGEVRRSYVLWQEGIAPVIAIEFVSGDGSEERDRTPLTGKFWVYEQGIRIPFYAIFEVEKDRVEVYHLVDCHYQRLSANARNHFVIPPLEVEIGIWHGSFMDQELPWVRWWDLNGHLLPTSAESGERERQRAEREQQRAEQEQQRAEQAEEKAKRLAEKLRAMGVDPDTV